MSCRAKCDLWKSHESKCLVQLKKTYFGHQTRGYTSWNSAQVAPQDCSSRDFTASRAGHRHLTFLPLMLGIGHSEQDLYYCYLWKLYVSAITLVSSMFHLRHTRCLEPRAHACTIAARESGKVTVYLVASWTNSMGNSTNIVRSPVVLGS